MPTPRSSPTAPARARPEPAPPAHDAGARRVLLVAAALIAAAIVVRWSTIDGDGSLPSALSDGITLAASVVIESLPFVFLGITISIAVQLWVPSRVLDAVIPRAGILRRAVLSLLGVVLPVCECGNVPWLAG